MARAVYWISAPAGGDWIDLQRASRRAHSRYHRKKLLGMPVAANPSCVEMIIALDAVWIGTTLNRRSGAGISNQLMAHSSWERAEFSEERIMTILWVDSSHQMTRYKLTHDNYNDKIKLNPPLRKDLETTKMQVNNLRIRHAERIRLTANKTTASTTMNITSKQSARLAAFR